jgi:hypothetical protein
MTHASTLSTQQALFKLDDPCIDAEHAAGARSCTMTEPSPPSARLVRLQRR